MWNEAQIRNFKRGEKTVGAKIRKISRGEGRDVRMGQRRGQSYYMQSQGVRDGNSHMVSLMIFQLIFQ